MTHNLKIRLGTLGTSKDLGKIFNKILLLNEREDGFEYPGKSISIDDD